MVNRESTIRVSRALRIVGITGVVLGIATVLGSTLFYVQDHDFSIFTTYLSDIGDTPGWPQVVFNSGMLIIAPVRYLFLILLVLQLRCLGAGRGFSLSTLILGALVVVGTFGMSAVPYSLNLAIHKTSALLYFLGAVILQTLIGAQEWRRKVRAVLPFSSLAVVAVYLIFAILLTLVGKVEGITRNTPVVWEWLAFCSLMFWLIAHSIVFGRNQTLRA
ncbi:MAG: DUF998 domain-containing protein [Proteobacteria bacterium]|nr:DUF998 domain-containing protein [Pseudomonadota bacterium]NIS68582.1 DUF998 domain-containing protein [Pseudomonadota bacterium]